ncbi:MAG TPA: hypothetical protein VN894_05915, partial [Polyangiaceae bacterium]|nr:hypothetical protein [Polyangiaceae bacterium]
MRTLFMCTALVPLFSIFAGCEKKQDDTQPPATAATAYPPPGYPPQAYPAQPYPQQPYPQQPYQQQPYQQQQPPYGQQPYPATAPTAPYGTYPAAPQSAPTPGPAPAPVPPAAPVASGQMAVPGPIAFQCQNDVPCGTHHCNIQYGKCAFPCQSAADCIAPNQCSLGLCVVP